MMDPSMWQGLPLQQHIRHQWASPAMIMYRNLKRYHAWKLKPMFQFSNYNLIFHIHWLLPRVYKTELKMWASDMQENNRKVLKQVNNLIPDQQVCVHIFNFSPNVWSITSQIIWVSQTFESWIQEDWRNERSPLWQYNLVTIFPSFWETSEFPRFNLFKNAKVL